ncbi:MAG: hypothetical protein U0Z26_12355 [Anaerolineales bacterium]
MQKILNDSTSIEEPSILKYHKAIEVLGRAIQETTLVFPFRLYSLKGKISKEAEISLRKILARLNTIRKSHQLTGLYPITQSTNLFYRKIAQAEKSIWLPLKPLITSPLAADEMSYYSRQGDEPLKLASQIINGNGVFLITGYRGVGKSTFINAALKNIDEIEKRSLEGYSLKVVPIQMNTAKVSSAGGILRLCIRAIYREFRKLEQTGKNYLNDEEKKHLTFANLRASYKVDLSQEEATARSKSLNAAFGFKLFDLLPGPLKLYLGGFLPEWQYKRSKDWSERMDQTIRLLDYDEDRAEEDIVQLINMLAEVRDLDGRSCRIKLVFIFDEMDKMDVEKGQDILIGQLKNLLLARHAVFLLVTSKEFYYKLLDDRKEEDSILGSVFSLMVTVPMFGTHETLELIKAFLDDISELSRDENKYIEDLARYLTYQSRGLPREIIRELRSQQKWTEETLQPYITDAHPSSSTLQVYSRIQYVIENLKNTAIPNELKELTQESSATTDRIWSNSGRNEQTLRGLYTLMEDLLNKGTAIIQRESLLPHVEQSQKSKLYNTQNFKLITEAEFFEIFDQLTRGLAKLRNPDDATAPLFQRKSLADGQGIEITVERSFYAITGRRVVHVEGLLDSQHEDTTKELLSKATQLLEQKDIRSAIGEALNLLAKTPQPKISHELGENLFDIFLNDKNLSYRLEASKYITSTILYSRLEKEYPNAFFQAETNEQLLTTLIRLLVDGSTTRKRQSLAKHVLNDMLKRFEDEKLKRENPRLLNSLILAASEIVDTNKNKEMAGILLVEILSVIDRSNSISDNILLALQTLATTAGHNLLIDLINAGYTLTLSNSILVDLLGSMPLNDVMELWKVAIVKKSTLLRQSILIQTLPILVANLPLTMSLLANWLNSPSWGREDTAILKAASVAEPNLYRDFASQFSNTSKGEAPENDIAYNKLTEIIGPSKQPKAVVKKGDSITSQPDEAADATNTVYKNPRWINVLLGVITFTTLMFLPIETQSISDKFILAFRQLINSIAIVMALSGILGIIVILSLYSQISKSNISTSSNGLFNGRFVYS